MNCATWEGHGRYEEYGNGKYGKASPKKPRQELQGQPDEGQILEQDKQHRQEQGVYSKCEDKSLKVWVGIYI